eukprot:CCRYP_017473-RA/>CCRYP_017473-RA protein AED:0.30 eAED:0.68 QI:161/0/0.33/1/0/0/3/0/148
MFHGLTFGTKRGKVVQFLIVVYAQVGVEKIHVLLVFLLTSEARYGLSCRSASWTKYIVITVEDEILPLNQIPLNKLQPLHLALDPVPDEPGSLGQVVDIIVVPSGHKPLLEPDPPPLQDVLIHINAQAVGHVMRKSHSGEIEPAIAAS